MLYVVEGYRTMILGVVNLYSKNKTKQIVVRLSSEQFELVNYYSDRFNGSRSDFIRMLIDWFTSLEVSENEKK